MRFDFNQNANSIDEIRDYVQEKGELSYFVHSYGCQQNVSDSERICGVFELLGLTHTLNMENSDFIIFNTCGVRHTANERVWSHIGALKDLKQSKNVIIGVCGCMVQQKGIAEQLGVRFPFLDLIFGTNLIHQLPEFLKEVLLERKRVIVTQATDEIVEKLPIKRGLNIRCLVPVMYGCDNFCSYCVVPYVRGKERSRVPENVIAEVKKGLQEGFKEILLLGQNVNSYGKGLPSQINFAKLLLAINKLPGEFRVRFLTSHPKDCSSELVAVVAQSKKICKQFHLPVQSGSNKVLKLMNRGYTSEEYLELIAHIREQIPGVTIGSDIIAGFPGETEEDFLETLELIKRVKFDQLFTFIYSPREGTRAAQMPDIVPRAEKKVWFKQLLSIQNEVYDEQNSKRIGEKKVVLPEQVTESSGKFTLWGKCDGGLGVEFAGTEALLGEFVTIVIETATRRNLIGVKI
ncbi:MAG: tRNA (N6-isopentenyl adenosine(37)-C2)-methylthiotransferase MiaB [Oscillospiraceae bacterium]|nr:tRNA (N6-isopentenyl adenosine(37)-C2)-methylthiotransferase MiaB [Oscillospiraceae bacterium]